MSDDEIIRLLKDKDAVSKMPPDEWIKFYNSLKGLFIKEINRHPKLKRL